MTPHPLLRRLAAAGGLAAALAAAVPGPAAAAVMISQVYGAGGNGGATYANDYVELFNSGAAAVSLDGWTLQYSSATGTSWNNQKVPLAGSIPAGGYYLVQLGSGGSTGAALPTPNVSATGINISAGAGKLALVGSITSLAAVTCPATSAAAPIVDLVGYGSTANCFEGSGTAPAPSATNAIIRASAGSGCQDTNANGADFGAVAAYPRNSGAPAQACRATAGNGGGGGGGGGTPQAKAIYEIQGAGNASPLVGTLVVTDGVVTRLTSNGFFMQDLNGDGNPLTSDGIFVFTGGTAYPSAAQGNLVRVTGTVAEFNVGSATNADTAAHTLTELTGVSGVALLGTGYTVTPVAVSLPEATDGDLERHEGMLVTIAGPLTVQQNFFQGRYGQLTLAAGGRLETPTNRWRPGTPQALALADANARARILLDDGSTQQNPNPTPYFVGGGVPRAGDTVGSVTGVIDYGLATSSADGFGDYKIHPTATLAITVTNPRSTLPPAVGGNLKLASFNVLNFFTTFTDGQTADGRTGQGCSLDGAVSAANCRGANSAAEYTRQRDKIVAAITAIGADALGLMEIQNNGNTAVDTLVAALNAVAGAGTYASVALPAAGTGSDAIRVAMVYRPARLAPVGAPASDTDPVNNRPPLAQTFQAANGERFTLVVNHLKSKGSCPATGAADYAGNADTGDGQGCWNALRVAQATRLGQWVAGLQAAAGSADVVLVGDFNAYAQEDPVYALTGSGWVDQIGRFNVLGYSYVFDGAAGRLDHAITSGSLSSKVSAATHWHINADEASVYDYNLEFKQPACAACAPDPSAPDMFRASDHDPVLIGLHLYKSVVGTGGRDVLVGSPGDDIIVGGPGADTLTGNGGSNLFGYTSMRDAGDTITDFAPGKDRLDLRLLLAGLGWNGSDPVAEGWVRFVASGSDTVVQVDADGPAAGAAFRPLATLKQVSPAGLSAARDLLVR